MKCWNVYREDYNRREIYQFNIFDHGRFNEEVAEILARKLPRDQFSEELRKTCMYYFWAKSEHEVVITSWPPYIDAQELERLQKEFAKEPRCKRSNVRLTVGTKIDIYDQLRLNWDAFVDYVYNI